MKCFKCKQFQPSISFCYFAPNTLHPQSIQAIFTWKTFSDPGICDTINKTRCWLQENSCVKALSKLYWGPGCLFTLIITYSNTRKPLINCKLKHITLTIMTITWLWHHDISTLFKSTIYKFVHLNMENDSLTHSKNDSLTHSEQWPICNVSAAQPPHMAPGESILQIKSEVCRQTASPR